MGTLSESQKTSAHQLNTGAANCRGFVQLRLVLLAKDLVHPLPESLVGLFPSLHDPGGSVRGRVVQVRQNSSFKRKPDPFRPRRYGSRVSELSLLESAHRTSDRSPGLHEPGALAERQERAPHTAHQARTLCSSIFMTTTDLLHDRRSAARKICNGRAALGSSFEDF